MELKQCIDKVFDSQQKIDPLKSHIFYDKDNIMSMTRWNYIWILYQTINSFSDIYNPYPSLIETVYSMALKTEEKVNKSCTGQITISPAPYFNIKTESGGFFSYVEANDEFNKFAIEFVDRVEKCKFTSLIINYDEYKEHNPEVTEDKGHVNALLIYNNKEDIHIALYEPHGSSCMEHNDFCQSKVEHINLFLLQLKNILESRKLIIIEYPNVTLHPRTSISRLQGIQPSLRENKTTRVGYCLMYSLFWIYLVLHCFDTIKDKDITTTLTQVEKLVLNKRDITQIEFAITGFAVSVYNRYMENIFENMDEKKKSFFLEKFEIMFRSTMIDQKIQTSRKRKTL